LGRRALFGYQNSTSEETEMADIANAADVVRPIKARTRKAASHLQAVASEAATEAGGDVHSLIDSLREQVSALAAQAERFAEERYDEAREIAGNVADAGAVAAARAGRQTVAAASAIRRDPLPAIVAVGIIGLIIALLIGQTGRR
jgi:hypothetical protein